MSHVTMRAASQNKSCVDLIRYISYEYRNREQILWTISCPDDSHHEPATNCYRSPIDLRLFLGLYRISRALY